MKDGDCQSGEQCNAGHCAIYFESFEPPGASTSTLGDSTHRFDRIDYWNGSTTRALKNKRTQIVFSGAAGCDASAQPALCAGAAGDGSYFLSIEPEPTAPRGTLNQGATCAACACCLACRDVSEVQTKYADPCRGTLTATPAPMCMAMPPTACSSFCTACASCPAAATQPGAGLTSCEGDAAKQGCTGCQAFNQCQMSMTGTVTKAQAVAVCAANPNNAKYAASCTFSNKGDSTAVTRDCNRCYCSSYDDCWSCRNFETDAQNNGLGDAIAQANRMHCYGQGDDGCYNTPVSITRSGLTDDEQSTVSPEIPAVAQANGADLELIFEYVPFSIGQCYSKPQQSVDPKLWVSQRQDLLIQFCGGNCSQSASWVDAKPTGSMDEQDACKSTPGSRQGAIPSDSQINNGLMFRNQDTQDWRSNLVRVPIPSSVRTANFRFRFVPNFHDGLQIGVDAIQIRRVQKSGGM
jgi:hypothetical protein